ncbi:hypothetical protein GGD54_002427 [Rhizobium tropici]|uniref:Uncharacterized protein n=1 Tax=Rhizobium tropici TaxID=398 RepID=A0ABR6QYL7_RHITR|nr:hypothetical protein [Rhizobium tropici]MBB5593655.1 hypothetical protein [Rhizobium tropici]MBB6492023.1 hypothetical protein [Rhizobium tropici]
MMLLLSRKMRASLLKGKQSLPSYWPTRWSGPLW